MLKEILKKFNEQQQGPKSFKLPDGNKVNLVQPAQRKALTQWILSLFGDNEKRAKQTTMSVVPRALGKSAPWPYLIRALWNMADRRSSFVGNTANYQEVKSEFVARFGKSRLALLNELSKLCTDHEIQVCGVSCDLSQDQDRAALLSWFLRHPYATFVALSPQNFYDFGRRKRLSLVINQVNKIIISETTNEKVASHKSETLKLLKTASDTCLPGTEYQEVLQFLHRFYTHCDHIYPLTFYNPYKSCESYLYNAEDRKDLLAYLVDAAENKSERMPDALKCDWLIAAVNLGIITHPLNWVISVLSRGFDTTLDWKDFDWYDTRMMCDRYGLIPVKNLDYYRRK